MPETDEDLVAVYLARGNEDVFAELVKRHLSGVYSFALGLVGQEFAAEDITQEVFLKAWKNIRRYDSTLSKFKTWLLRIARNTCIDYLRKRKSIPFSELASPYADDGADTAALFAERIPDPDPLPDEILAQAESAEAVVRAVEQLSPRQREVLTLHYTEHLTFEEIGHVLGQPTNTVKSRHHRALAALRGILAPNDAS